MTRFTRRSRASAAALLSALLVTTGCEKGFFAEPAPTYPASLALQYNVATASATDPRAAFDSANNLRIRVTGPGVSIDTVLPFTPAEETRVRLALDSVQENHTYRAEVMVRRGADVLLAGVTTTEINEDEAAVASVSLAVAPIAANAITTGFFHTCALDEAGAAYCWGANSAGQLGTGDNTASSTPVAVAGDLRFVQITASFNRTCALTAAGQVFCWGAVPRAASTNVPTLVATNERFTSITAGHSYVCGLTAEQSAFCWGNNSKGELGTGDTTFAATPVPVSGGLSFQSITTGLSHTCGIATDGRSFCWGWNAFGQSGTGISSAAIVAPSLVGGGHTFSSLSAGASTTCGIAGAQTLCWGGDYFGSLGTGAPSNGTMRVVLPAEVVGGHTFRAVRTPDENSIFAPTCGLTASGNAFCWGANSHGQLGNAGTFATCTNQTEQFNCTGSPVAVAGGLPFASIAPGSIHTCAITSDKRLYCWGDNESGQLGIGSPPTASVPVEVTGGITWPRGTTP